MPTKRAVLGAMKKHTLVPWLDHWGLEVDDRRVKERVVDALARSKKARLAEILAEQSRADLKALCVALNLDDRGQAKADIIARLLGSEAAKPSSKSTASPTAKQTDTVAEATNTQRNLSNIETDAAVATPASAMAGAKNAPSRPRTSGPNHPRRQRTPTSASSEPFSWPPTSCATTWTPPSTSMSCSA